MEAESGSTGRTGPFTFDGELLHSAPLSSAAVWWQTEVADAAARSDAGAQDVVGVKVIASLRRERFLVSAERI